jgi:uncharacterized membrane protein
MRALYLVSVTLHVLAASAWLGASVFLAAVLVPSLRGHDRGARAELLAATGRRLRALVWPLFALLVVTGVVQLGFRGYRWADLAGPLWTGPGGVSLAVKLALFAATLVVSGAHDFVLGPRALAAGGDPARRERHRRLASWLGRATLLLAISIFAAAVAFVRGGFAP